MANREGELGRRLRVVSRSDRILLLDSMLLVIHLVLVSLLIIGSTIAPLAVLPSSVIVALEVRASLALVGVGVAIVPGVVVVELPSSTKVLLVALHSVVTQIQ